MIRSILVHADDRPAMAARTETALNLARAFGAHVQFHIDAPQIPVVASEPFAGAAVSQALVDSVEAETAERVAVVTGKMDSEDVIWASSVSDGDIVQSLTAAAQLADLTIVSVAAAGTKPQPVPADLAGRLVLGAHGPVLVLPASAPPTHLDGVALVAWDGSTEAAHAVRAAVPLLTRASRVHVATIVEKNPGFPATDALRYLSQHGIHAEAVVEQRGLATVEEALEACADRLGAQWIVMGAFGHGRLRETLFGGVTRYMIDGAKRPIVLMH